MPFDTNALANPVVPQPANILDQAASALQLRNALLGNKIQQAEYDARMAQGNALLGATDASGHTDYGKARAAMAADPRAAYGAADAYSAQNRSRHEDVLNQDEQLAFQQHASTAAADGMGRLVDDPSNANVRGYGAFMKRLTPGAADQINAITDKVLSLPTVGQRKEALKAAFTAHMGQEAANRVFGTPTSVDDGQTIQTGTQASGMDGGAFTRAAGVQHQLSPEFKNHLVPVTGPDGSQRFVTQGAITGSGRPTVPPSVMGNGSYPGGAPQQTAQDPGGYVASPAAGQVAAQEATAGAGAQGANALMQAASGRNERMAMLGNMGVDLNGFTPGPGHARLRSWKALAANWGVPVPTDDVDAAQGFDKWAQNVANAQAGALGHSDARLAAAEHAMPNSRMQKGTITTMLHQLMGNEDAINAKATAWKSSGLQPAQYQSWEQNFNQHFDPRAFQILRMTPEEREATFKGMRESGQFDDFKRTYNQMAAAGLVPGGR